MKMVDFMVPTRDVKKTRGTGTGKLGNQETGVSVSILVWENQKLGTPVPIPGFWYPVFAGLPGTGLNIYIF
jgi:hypothetical protein